MAERQFSGGLDGTFLRRVAFAEKGITMFDDVKVARELYVGYSGIHGAEAAIFQPQRLFAVDQLFFTWPQFRRKTRKPCLVVLLTKAMPSLLLTLAPPPRYVEMETEA
jgi:hypothetical protein